MSKELYKELQKKAMKVITEDIYFKDSLIESLKTVEYLDIPENTIFCYYGLVSTMYTIDKIKYDSDQGILIHCCKKQKDRKDIQECNEWIIPRMIECYDLKNLFIKEC